MSGAVQRPTFTTSRLIEFASIKELVAQTGHEPDDWPMMVVKELVDNALDACEEAGIGPVIKVTVAGGKIRVRDNGPGIPPETVDSILDFNTRTSSREAYVAPDRGRQGNALKTILAMPFALSGEEDRVDIEARGIRHEITFRVDRIAQQPVIDYQQHDVSVRNGTAITVHWPASASSDLAEARSQFLPIVERFTDLNPHLTIRGIWTGDGQRKQWSCQAADPSWQKWTPSAPTCPHWYRVEDLERLAGAFLHHDRQHKAVRLLRDFLAQFNGLTGTSKRKAVLDAVDLQRAPLECLLSDGDFDHNLVRRLLVAMQMEARPIRPAKLGALSKANVEACLEAYDGDPDSIRYKLVKGVDDGVPWLAEAAFAWRPYANRRKLLTGVNWSPSLRTGNDPFRLGYQLGASYCGDDAPVVVLAHLICPRPEFTDRGKSNLAYHSPGFTAVREAVEEVTEPWAKLRRAEIRDSAVEARRAEKISRQRVAEVSLKELVRTHLPTVIDEVSSQGQISFTQRDLFYVMRPIIQQEHEKTLTYSYFTQILTEIENEQGSDIEGLQREDRGSIYHPHLHEEVSLSTATVANYRRPFWTFNKLVLVEKAGTQQNLVEMGWPEEHDCAVVSTKGFTTRAVKDLFDALALSPEPLTLFCVHDADAAGTLIYHTLVAETKARGARKIAVVNIGLEPWEGIEMGLEVEAVDATEKHRPVAPYVAEHDAEWRDWLEARGFDSWEGWLQKYRIELNAMAPLDRIAWITRKIEAYPPRKVVPPAPVLHDERVRAARNEITEELTRRARIEERAEKVLATIKWPDADKLPPIVTRYLDRGDNRRDSWTDPMLITGKKHAKRVLK